MKQVNMHDAKSNLSRYVAELKPGETLVLCNRNRPVAEIRPIHVKKPRIPRIGVAEGLFEVTDAFFEPLPEDMLKGLNGE